MDGLLKTDEIASLRLRDSLVILAACDSAAADARADEDLFRPAARVSGSRCAQCGHVALEGSGSRRG